MYPGITLKIFTLLGYVPGYPQSILGYVPEYPQSILGYVPVCLQSICPARVCTRVLPDCLRYPGMYPCTPEGFALLSTPLQILSVLGFIRVPIFYVQSCSSLVTAPYASGREVSEAADRRLI